MFDFGLMAKLVPLYILVGLGFLAGRFLSISRQDIGKLVLYFLSPAVIFRGFYQSELNATLFLLPLLTFSLACLFGWLGLHLAGRGWQDGTERILAFSAGTGNTGFFGIPATLSILGEEAFPYLVISVFGFIVFEVTYGFYLVMRIRFGIRRALTQVLAYPGLHAFWVGLLFNALDIPLPEFATAAIKYLTDGYTLLGMLIIGLGLSAMKKSRLDAAYLGFAFAAKFVAWPLAMGAVIFADRAWLGWIPVPAQWVLLCLSLVPMAALTIVHASIHNSHPDKASLAVGLSTLLALIYLPLGIAFFRLVF